MSFHEVQQLLRLMNVEMEQEHAFQLFQVSLSGKYLQKPNKATFSLDRKYSDPFEQHSFIESLLRALSTMPGSMGSVGHASYSPVLLER